MERLLKKYEGKLVEAGLADPGEPLLLGIDAELVWNREDPRVDTLRGVFDRLSINSLLVCRPAQPYREIIEYLMSQTVGAIRPRDTETRTFLHDLPVAREAGLEAIVSALSSRKCVLLPGGEIATYGTVSPEQAFVIFSSVCFGSFVKFFSDQLRAQREGSLEKRARGLLRRAFDLYPELPSAPPKLHVGPLDGENTATAAMIEAGSALVRDRLVDSFFGNISCLVGDTIYVSQTGSSLDELAGCIDPVPIRGGSTAGLTASSELIAHRRIYETTPHRVILHGHPKFTVILSLDCPRQDCPNEGRCHLSCSANRTIGNVPIVPGEVGAGPHGLCHTLPPAVERSSSAVVYGHGLFAAGERDFNEAMAATYEIERLARAICWERVGL